MRVEAMAVQDPAEDEAMDELESLIVRRDRLKMQGRSDPDGGRLRRIAHEFELRRVEGQIAATVRAFGPILLRDGTLLSE